MSSSKLSIAIVFATLCVLGVFAWIVKLTDEPDPMDDAHGDVPEMPNDR